METKKSNLKEHIIIRWCKYKKNGCEVVVAEQGFDLKNATNLADKVIEEHEQDCDKNPANIGKPLKIVSKYFTKSSGLSR